mgnify:CR=1 FL=1
MNIREIHENKKQFLPLLLLADEQENMIDRYLDRGTLLALYDGGLRAVCVVTKEAPACSRSKSGRGAGFQRQGVSAGQVRHVAGACRTAGGTCLLVGTGDSALTSLLPGLRVPGKPPGPQFLPSILRPPHIRRGAAFVGHGIFVHGALSGKGGAAENQRRRLYHTV